MSRGRRATPQPAEPAPRAAISPFQERLAGRQVVVEQELRAAAGDASLCAISKSGGPVDGVKYLEGRLATLMQLRRQLRGATDASAEAEVLATVTSEWRSELDAVRTRDAGPAWIAYRSGGVDELDELRS